MYGDDEFMDEELIEILHEIPFHKKEIQTSCLDIPENSQQLIMSSLPEIDISQNFDSTSYNYFPEIDDKSRRSCQSLCDQEGSREYHPDCPSYHSTPKFFPYEDTSHVKSKNTLLQQQFLQNYNVSVDDYIENSNSGKWKSDSPSTCSEISSKEEPNI